MGKREIKAVMRKLDRALDLIHDAARMLEKGFDAADAENNREGWHGNDGIDCSRWGGVCPSIQLIATDRRLAYFNSI